MIIEEQSFKDDSIFNFILKSGNECNIDATSDGTIVLEKYNELFKQKRMYDFIFIDVFQNSLKGYDSLVSIRLLENDVGIHTKMVGILNKRNDKAMINKNMKIEFFDNIIEKSIKEFNELIYS